MATIIKKYQLYGLKYFIIFSFIEIGRVFGRVFLKTFSQNQEDLIIEKLLQRQVKSYVDIGSNQPVKFNNTYRFYLSGSRGINIEPNLSLIKSYRKLRPYDKNLQLGIADHNSTRIFYQLDPDVDSTFSKSQAENKVRQGLTLTSRYPVKNMTLNHLFQKYLNSTDLDLLTIDTEGYDYQILQSNNWSKYLPKVICIEDNQLKTQKLLLRYNYSLKAITANNSIYFHKDD